ncbi:MAG: NusG domain II-containing protein [Clostridia bacterium]|nr:NusG domain II-containing protein [Clostridia bacterium]
MKRKFKNDLRLIGGILLVAIICFILFFATLEPGDFVQISVNGKAIKSFDLNKNTEFEIVTGENDEQINLLVIENGYAFIKSANCPDKICEHHIKIKNSGETIVCLPHKVVISIESVQYEN